MLRDTPVTPSPALAPPLPRRAPRITVVARDERTTLGAVVAWDGVRWRVLAAADRGTTSLGEDLHALVAALSRGLRGERPPRDVALLWSEVTTAVIEVPAAGLPAERLEALLGWELEPYLPGEHAEGNGAGVAGVACGWAQPSGAGPLLACGVRPEVRDQVREVVGQCGLRLRGLYPLLGCAAAELGQGAAGARVVLEVGSGAVAATRLEGERVTRARVSRCPLGAEAATAAGLVPADAGLVLAAPLPARLRDLVGEDAPLLSGPAEAPALPVGVLGAARHALGLPGGERIACVPPHTRRRLKLTREHALFAGIAALVLLIVGGGEAWVARGLRQSEARLAELQGLTAQLPERKPLEDRLQQARERLALARDLRARRDLPRVLRALAEAAPEELMIERLAEEPEGVLRIEGVALSELAVRRLTRDVGLGLAPFGLRPGDPEVRRREAHYAFTLRCLPPIAPAPRPAGGPR